jgi:hypothetical protein
MLLAKDHDSTVRRLSVWRLEIDDGGFGTGSILFQEPANFKVIASNTVGKADEEQLPGTV